MTTAAVGLAVALQQRGMFYRARSAARDTAAPERRYSCNQLHIRMIPEVIECLRGLTDRVKLGSLSVPLVHDGTFFIFSLVYKFRCLLLRRNETSEKLVVLRSTDAGVRGVAHPSFPVAVVLEQAGTRGGRGGETEEPVQRNIPVISYLRKPKHSSTAEIRENSN